MAARCYPSPYIRFWAKVNKTNDCWLWMGKTATGYGRLKVKGREIQAHRFAYELLVGSIPDGLELDHLCRVRHCVKPTHLEPVTRRVNILRGEGKAAKLARATHCIHGHPFDFLNTYAYKGHRFCKLCKSLRQRALAVSG